MCPHLSDVPISSAGSVQDNYPIPTTSSYFGSSASESCIDHPGYPVAHEYLISASAKSVEAAVTAHLDQLTVNFHRI